MRDSHLTNWKYNVRRIEMVCTSYTLPTCRLGRTLVLLYTTYTSRQLEAVTQQGPDLSAILGVGANDN